MGTEKKTTNIHTCVNKQRYETIRLANRDISEAYDKHKKQLYAYKCEHCQMYHLTSSKRGSDIVPALIRNKRPSNEQIQISEMVRHISLLNEEIKRLEEENLRLKGKYIPEFKSVFLTGFMGSGKTTFLKALEKMSQEKILYLDLDELMLNFYQEKSVKSVVDKIGWDAFRKKEVELAESWLNSNERFVLALGGGTLTFDLAKKIKEKASLVWLDTPFKMCLERIRSSDRPLKELSDKEIQMLYKKRLYLYEMADKVIKP